MQLLMAILFSSCDSHQQSRHTIEHGIDLQAQAIRMADMQVSWVLVANRQNRYMVQVRDHQRYLPRMDYEDYFELDKLFYPLLATLDSFKQEIYSAANIQGDRTEDLVQVLKLNPVIRRGFTDRLITGLSAYNKTYWSALQDKPLPNKIIAKEVSGLDSLIKQAGSNLKNVSRTGRQLIVLSRLELDILDIKQKIAWNMPGNSISCWFGGLPIHAVAEPMIVKKGDVVKVTAYAVAPQCISNLPYYISKHEGAKKIYAEKSRSGGFTGINFVAGHSGLNTVRGAMEYKNDITGEMQKWPFQVQYYVTD